VKKVCTLPPEFCEFGNSKGECRGWLQEHHANLFARLYADAAAPNAKPEAKAESNAAKPPAAAADANANTNAKDKDKAKRAKDAPRIVINKEQFNKRRCVTHVKGLELFGTRALTRICVRCADFVLILCRCELERSEKAFLKQVFVRLLCR
jgi:hypothetical protein